MHQITKSKNLNDLNGVTITSPIDGDVLKYDATLGKWVNAAGGGGSSFAIATGNLLAGNTQVTISDVSITANSLIVPFVDEDFVGVAPIAQATTTGSVTLTFPVQSTDMPVKVMVI